MDTRTSPARLRIERIREALAAARAAPPCWCRRATRTSPNTCPSAGRAGSGLSGFTGSIGTLVVTLDKAALFADSRYWVQAERELAGSGIELVKIATAAARAPHRMAGRNLAAGATVAVDGDVLGLGAARQLRAELEAAASACAPTSTSSPAPGPTGRRLPTAAVYEHRAPQAPESRPRAARPAARRDARRRARPTISSRPSTTSPGSSTCAAPTSATTRSSSPTC